MPEDSLIDDHGIRIHDLEESRVEVAGQIAELKANVNDAREDIKEMRNDMKDMKSELKVDFNALDRKLDDLTLMHKREPKKWYADPKFWKTGAGVALLGIITELAHKLFN